MSTSKHFVHDANDAIRAEPLSEGAYCRFCAYGPTPEYLDVTLDGELTTADLRRVLKYMEQIEEEMKKK